MALDHTEEEYPILSTPIAFGRIDDRLYRSSYPCRQCYAFIKSLHLKSVICLNPDEIRGDLREFCHEQDIKIYETDVKFNQEPFLIMEEEKVTEAIKFAQDPTNRPCLIFCTNGRLRTSCVVGCLRKVQAWSLVSIIHEFEQFVPAETSIGNRRLLLDESVCSVHKYIF
eukprot:gene4328-8616_t